MSIVYLLHAFYCMLVASIRVIFTIDTLRIWKIFEQDCFWVKLILVKMSESRLEGRGIDLVNMTVEKRNESRLANMVFMKVLVGVQFTPEAI